MVLSREYRVRTDLDALEIYKRLVELNPSPYTFILEFEKTVVGGAHPKPWVPSRGGEPSR